MQYPIPLQPPASSQASPSTQAPPFNQASPSTQTPPFNQASPSTQTPPFTQASPSDNAFAPLQPPSPPQGPPQARPSTTVQPAGSEQPSSNIPLSSSQASAPLQADKLKSVPTMPFYTPQFKQPQRQSVLQEEAFNNASSGIRKQKDTLTAYLYWICLGSHYYYLENMRTQVIFWITLGGCGLWWLIDMFRIPGLVRDYAISQSLDMVLQAEALKKVQSAERNQP